MWLKCVFRLGAAFLPTGADTPAAHPLISSTLRTPVILPTRCQIDCTRSLWYLPQVPQVKPFLLHLNSPHCFRRHLQLNCCPAPSTSASRRTPLWIHLRRTPLCLYFRPSWITRLAPATYSPEQLNKFLYIHSPCLSVHFWVVNQPPNRSNNNTTVNCFPV